MRMYPNLAPDEPYTGPKINLLALALRADDWAMKLADYEGEVAYDQAEIETRGKLLPFPEDRTPYCLFCGGWVCVCSDVSDYESFREPG